MTIWSKAWWTRFFAAIDGCPISRQVDVATLRLDASPIVLQAQRLGAALAEFLERRPEAGERLLGLFERGAAFHLDCLPAGRTGEQRVVFQPLPAFFEELAAMGASDAELVRVEEALRHDTDSIVGADTATIEQIGS